MEEKSFIAPQTSYQNNPVPPENQPLQPAPPTYSQSINGGNTPQFLYQPQSTVVVQTSNPQSYQSQAVVTSTLPASNTPMVASNDPAAATDNQSSNWKKCAKFCNWLFAVFMLIGIVYSIYN